MFRVALLSLTLAGVQLVLAGPGVASTSGAVRDGRDAKGKPDFASVGYSRAADRSLTHTVRFYSPVASKSFTAKGNMLAFAFYINGDKSADRLAVLVWSSGALRGRRRRLQGARPRARARAPAELTCGRRNERTRRGLQLK